jgi:hypothetical protein
MKKALIIFTLIIMLIFGYLIYSVYKPIQFISNNISNDIDFQLKSFSLTKPKYIGYQYDAGYDRYNIYDFELNRNTKLGWDLIDQSQSKKIVLKADIQKFKENKQINNEIKNNLMFEDKYTENDSDTFEQKEYKRLWHPPIRTNSVHSNIDKFKFLKNKMNCEEFGPIIGGSDFNLGPSEFYPGYFRRVYNIGSPKISFVFITFKDGYPCFDTPEKYLLEDIVIITQTQEMIKVPVNPDGTYNWEAVKDKID